MSIETIVHYKIFISFIYQFISQKKKITIAYLFVKKGWFQKCKSVYGNVRVDEELNSALFQDIVSGPV